MTARQLMMGFTAFLISASGAVAEPIYCPKVAGLIAGPYVPTATTARRIFLAIRDAVAAPIHKTKYDLIHIEDSGKTWTVYETRKADEPVYEIHGKTETFKVTGGGGGLGLEIDKCTGIITNAAYQR